MKIVWVAIGLLVSGLSIGVACGPKETYCYKEGKPCSVVKREMEQADAGFMAEMADAAVYHCFPTDAAPYDSTEPCPT
jgi:hypothetical protein